MIRWEGPYDLGGAGTIGEGFDPQGRVAVRVVRHSTGWHAYLRGDRVDRVDHSTAEEAKAAAEAAWALAPEPPRRRVRDHRLVGNVEGERPPHPGTLKRPPG